MDFVATRAMPDWPCQLPTLPHGTEVLSGPGLLYRALLGFVAQQQPGMGLLFMPPIAIESCADTLGLDSHLRPC